jgi:hypothetical protein
MVIERRNKKITQWYTALGKEEQWYRLNGKLSNG